MERPNKATSTSPPWPAFVSPTVNLRSTVANVILCHVPSHAKALLQGLCDNSKGMKIVVLTYWRSETGAKNVWITVDTV